MKNEKINNYPSDYEATGELLVRAAKEKRKGSSKYILIAVIAVAALACAAGFFLHSNHQYNQQVDLAAKYFEEGNYEQAEIEFTAAVAMQPRKVPAREGLAYTKAVRGKYDEATDIYQGLYDDTGDEKYRKAAEDTKNKQVPEDDLRPRRNIEPPDGPQEQGDGTSTSNTSNGGKVAFIDGQVYYIIQHEETYYGEDFEDDIYYYSSAIYAADADGSNARLIYSPSGDSVVQSILYQDGVLYAIRTEYDFNADANTVDLLELDPASGKELASHKLGSNLWVVGYFFIEGRYCVCEVEWGDGYSYPLSVHMDTGAATALFNYDDYAEGQERIFSRFVCRDGWVWMTEGSYHYDEDEDDDSDDSWTETSLLRVRPDGSGRETLFTTRGGKSTYTIADDLSICGQKLYLFFSNYDGDYEYESMSVRVFDLKTAEQEAVYDLSNSNDLWKMNNVDGSTFYALSSGSDEEANLNVFNLQDRDVQELIFYDEGFLNGVYYNDGRLYLDVTDYYYNEDEDEETWFQWFLVTDSEGNAIGSLKAA